MKQNNKKGVSLIVIVVTIIIMIILVAVVNITGSDAINKTKIAKLKTEISEIEALMKTYVIRNSGSLDFETAEFDTTALTEEELLQFEQEPVVSNTIQMYVVNLSKIDAEETVYGNMDGEDDRYLYSETTKHVYYQKGIKIDSVNYYRPED